LNESLSHFRVYFRLKKVTWVS